MIRYFMMGLLFLAPLGFYPFLRDAHSPMPVPPPPAPGNPLAVEHELALHCFAAQPGYTFPGSLPWESLRRIGDDRSQAMTKLAESDPVEFLKICLERYKKDVQAYRCTFEKREVVKGTERENEIIRAHFREKPFSVHMEWKEGASLCSGSLYVEGENGGNLLARSLIFGVSGPILSRPLNAADVKSTSRFGIDTFGIYLGQKATYDAIVEAKKDGVLFLNYKGIEPCAKAGNRLCYKFVRTPYEPPDPAEGLNDLTFYIDRATLLQVGSVLTDDKGKFIAEYYFRDIEVNPVIDEKQFTRKAL